MPGVDLLVVVLLLKNRSMKKTGVFFNPVSHDKKKK